MTLIFCIVEDDLRVFAYIRQPKICKLDPAVHPKGTGKVLASMNCI